MTHSAAIGIGTSVARRALRSTSSTPHIALVMACATLMLAQAFPAAAQDVGSILATQLSEIWDHDDLRHDNVGRDDLGHDNLGQDDLRHGDVSRTPDELHEFDLFDSLLERALWGSSDGGASLGGVDRTLRDAADRTPARTPMRDPVGTGHELAWRVIAPESRTPALRRTRTSAHSQGDPVAPTSASHDSTCANASTCDCAASAGLAATRSAAPSIPEPGTLILALTAGVAACWRRRPRRALARTASTRPTA